MFNAPRSPSNRYGSPLSNGLLGSTTSLASDPLVASAYIDPDAGLDPWSINPSPAPLPDPPSALNAILGMSDGMVLLSKAEADGIRQETRRYQLCIYTPSISSIPLAVALSPSMRSNES